MTRAELDQVWYTVTFALEAEFSQRGWLAPGRRDDRALRNAAVDALAGWKYIREHHGDLYGVGWDRVETALEEALAMPSQQRSTTGE